MPNETIEDTWKNFVVSLDKVLVIQANDRPLDQLLIFRNSVLRLIQDDYFQSTLFAAWKAEIKPPKGDQSNDKEVLLQEAAREVLALELQGITRAVEVAQALKGTSEESNGWWKAILGRCSIATGSVKDILENLPPSSKNILTLLKELLDLFKG
jgi:hypothetical protein